MHRTKTHECFDCADDTKIWLNLRYLVLEATGQKRALLDTGSNEVLMPFDQLVWDTMENAVEAQDGTVTTMVIPGVRQWPARTAEILFKAEIRTSAGAFPSLKKQRFVEHPFFTKITHSQQFYRVCFTAYLLFWNFYQERPSNLLKRPVISM